MADAGDRIEHVERVARAGGEVALAGFRTDIEVETKTDVEHVVNPGDAVTAVDRAAQRRVIELVHERFPDDAIVGEEDEERKTVPEDGFAWVIDPIDGTYNFVRGLAYWSTAVALVDGPETLAATTAVPALGDVYVGRTDGVTLNGTPVSVSERTDPHTFAVTYTIVPKLGDRDAYAEGVGEMLSRFGEVRRVGSAHVVLALIASGALDGTVTTAVAEPWDSIGGVYLVRRAGGTVTDVHGEPWKPGCRGLVASNGNAHEELLAVARRMTGR
jgi:myo-inositol-1(or 4)-monophosphatase